MTILFAVDLTEPFSAVQWVERLTQKLQADLLVLHVDTPVEEMAQTPAEPFSGIGIYDPYSLYDPASRKEIKRSRQHAFEEFVQTNFSIPVRLALREGHPTQTIIKDAQTHKADLIVLGKRRPPILERLLIGNVAQDISEQTNIPTLLVPLQKSPSAAKHNS